MKQDKISVVVPVFNGEATIERCLASILGGGYQNLEVIVVNDGSTDGTRVLVEAMASKDPRIRLINQKNQGCGNAKSAGARASCGDYISFCDADDWYEPNFLEEHHRHITKYDADISQCLTHQTESAPPIYSDEIEILQDDLLGRYLQYQSISVTLWDKLYKRELLDCPGIESDLRAADDLYMNYVASRKCRRIVKFSTTSYNWYCRSDSLSRQSFNPATLKNDFASWKRIIDDCRVNYPHLEETARLSSELWIAGTYRSMVNSHYHNAELEKKIAAYIRQDGIKKTLAAEHNKANKRFIRLALVSMPLARYAWYAVGGIKYLAKIALRK